ncbi:hypothetical protein Tco_1398693, partial [Tanacetum coccineum]
GTRGEDAVKHIEYFLKVVNPIDLPYVNQDKLRVVVFPISLAGDAWKWIETTLFNYETPLCEKFKEFNYLLKIDPDLFTKDIEGFKTYEEYKDDWIYEWKKTYLRWTRNLGLTQKNDGFCNGGNLPGAYIIGNSLQYQDYEWYEALKDSELKEDALRNKAIMEGLIDDDNDDESHYECKKRWNVYDDTNHGHEIDHEANEREVLCEIHELPVCNMRRFEMIKYSFGR